MGQTGSFSKVGFGDMEALGVVFSFTVGAMISGLLLSHISLRVPLYDVLMIVQAGLLTGSFFFADQDTAKYLASAACGLQNGLATHWGGPVVRTTHVTGLFTDVGLLLGRLTALVTTRRFRLDAKDLVSAADDLSKLALLGGIAVAFLGGIILGTTVFESVGPAAILMSAVAIGFIGCAYLCYRVFGQCFSSKEEMAMDKDIERMSLWRWTRMSMLPASLMVTSML